ncbi:unnamed protein product [Prunus armeniaca]
MDSLLLVVWFSGLRSGTCVSYTSKSQAFGINTFAEYRLALHHLTSFLKASPFLQRLALKLDFSLHIDGRKIKKAVKCPHHYLKIYPIETYPSEMDRGSKEVVEEAKAREHAMQLVKLKLP